MMTKWYSGNHEDLKLPDICLAGEEKPREKPHSGNLSRPVEPGPAAWQARKLSPAPQRWTGCSRIKSLERHLRLKETKLQENGKYYIMLSYMHCIFSPNIISNLKSTRLRWAGHVASMEQSRNAHRIVAGEHNAKRPLGRPRRRWEDNIKKDLREVGCDTGHCIVFAQDRDR